MMENSHTSLEHKQHSNTDTPRQHTHTQTQEREYNWKTGIYNMCGRLVGATIVDWLDGENVWTDPSVVSGAGGRGRDKLTKRRADKWKDGRKKADEYG